MQFKKALSYNILLKLINVIILFFSNIVFVRIVGAEITGLFFYLITLLSFITLVISCSLESGITYYAAKGYGNTIFYAWLILAISLLQIPVCFFILLCLPHALLSTNYLLVFVISNILVSCFTGLFISQKWFVSVNTVIMATNILSLALLIYLLKKFPVNAVIKAEKIYILSFALQAAGLICMFFKKNRIAKWKMPIGIVVKIFKYSALALAGNVCFFLVTRLDYFFVNRFCSSTALGNYVQVSRLGQLFVLLPTMAASVIFPFAAHNSENILAKVQWLCRLMTMIIFAGSLFIIISGKWIFPWFYGRDFSLMYAAILFYLPGVFSLCISSLLASYISGKGSIAVNVKASVLALIIVVLGDVVFIPAYGINAAAAVSSVAYTACMFYLLRHFIKIYHSKVGAFFTISFTEFRNILSYIKSK